MDRPERRADTITPNCVQTYTHERKRTSYGAIGSLSLLPVMTRACGCGLHGAWLLRFVTAADVIPRRHARTHRLALSDSAGHVIVVSRPSAPGPPLSLSTTRGTRPADVWAMEPPGLGQLMDDRSRRRAGSTGRKIEHIRQDPR
ncbi:unnamed protein product [Soboliphyme baturini]|uniref:Transposase n=1 Tax=Soboliphyme baturini TaxID=241478 RepID=A0A183IXI1_9BILA|nr:unnamed protein product [Soboliphyme baturini]